MLAPSVVSRSVRVLLLTALFGFAACATGSSSEAKPVTKTSVSKDRASITSEAEAMAQVIAVDREHRVVTLRGEGGRLAEVACGDAVRNFEQIRVGDVLKVRYRQELTVTRLPADAVVDGAGAAVAAGRAQPGQRPAGAVGAMASARVTIVSLDSERDIVVFALPSQELVAHHVATAEGREFVKGLQVGDKVQIDGSVALALAVEPVK